MGSDAWPDGRHTAFLQKRRKAREKAQGPIQQQLRERSCSLEDEVGSVRSRLPCTTASLQKFSCVYQPCWHLGAPPARPAPALALLPARVRLPQARPQPAQLQAAQHPARPSTLPAPAPAPLSSRQANDTRFGVGAPGLPLLRQKSGSDYVPSLSWRGTLPPEKRTWCLKGKQHSGKAATAECLGEAGVKALMLFIRTPF